LSGVGESGGWKAEDRGWRVEGRGWRVEGGKVEKGLKRVFTIEEMLYRYFFV
jgi:hypothetical protein